MNSKNIAKTAHSSKVSKYSSNLITKGLKLALSIKNKDDENYLKTLLEEGVNLYEIREYRKALDVLDKIKSIDPSCNILKLGETKATSSSKFKRYKEAVEFFSKILEIEKNVNYLDILLEGIYKLDLNEQYEQYREALIFHEVAIRVKPDDYWWYFYQGSTQCILGLYEEALESFNKSIALEVNAPSVWSTRAIALQELHRYTDALNDYDKAIELGADNEQTWLGKGEVLDKLQRYEEAEISYNKAKQLKKI